MHTQPFGKKGLATAHYLSVHVDILLTLKAVSCANKAVWQYLTSKFWCGCSGRLSSVGTPDFFDPADSEPASQTTSLSGFESGTEGSGLEAQPSDNLSGIDLLLLKSAGGDADPTAGPVTVAVAVEPTAGGGLRLAVGASLLRLNLQVASPSEMCHICESFCAQAEDQSRLESAIS